LRNVRGVAHRRNCLCPPVPLPARPSTYLNLITSFFLLKNQWPPGRNQFWPQGYNLNNLGRGSLCKVSCHIFNLLPLSIQRRRFFKFSLYTYKENYRLWGRAGNFNTRDIIKTTLVEDP
jgi:hypothetical protein